MGLTVQMRAKTKVEEWKTENFHSSWDAGRWERDKLLEKQKENILISPFRYLEVPRFVFSLEMLWKIIKNLNENFLGSKSVFSVYRFCCSHCRRRGKKEAS